MTGSRADALARLDVFVGAWVVVARFALDFRQRFTGTFSADQNTISGAWETSPADGGKWKHDFGLTYRRAGRG